MSTPQVDLATASQLFDTEVTIQYQNASFLKGMTVERWGTTGDATNVPVSDRIEMQESSYAASNIPVTPVNFTNVQVVPIDYKVKTVVGGGYKTLFAYDWVMQQAKLHGLAVGRMMDYIKINSIFSSSLLGDIEIIASTVGATSGLNSQKMAAAISYLEDQGVPVHPSTCSLWTSARTKTALYEDEKVTNIFYVDRKPLPGNNITEYLDFQLKFLGSNGINTIPYTSAGSPAVDTYQVPLVHRDSIVHIYNRAPSTQIVWVGQEDRYEIVTTMTSGASIIQTNGIVLLECEVPSSANA